MRLAVILAAVAVAAACAGSDEPAGVMEVEWSGPDTALIRASATALWCREGHWLEVTGLLGDTGVAVVVYPADTVRTGQYAVHDPADSLGSGAGVALRWFGEDAVHAFQSRSGSVTVSDDEGGTVRGRFEALVVAVIRPETLTVTGEFRRTSVTLGADECAGRVSPPGPDMRVD